MTDFYSGVRCQAVNSYRVPAILLGVLAMLMLATGGISLVPQLIVVAIVFAAIPLVGAVWVYKFGSNHGWEFHADEALHYKVPPLARGDEEITPTMFSYKDIKKVKVGFGSPLAWLCRYRTIVVRLDKGGVHYIRHMQDFNEIATYLKERQRQLA